MQIIGLHKNIYKLASYSLSQEKLETHRKKYEKPAADWKKLKSEGLSDKTAQEIVGISRATYYRYKKHLERPLNNEKEWEWCKFSLLIREKMCLSGPPQEA